MSSVYLSSCKILSDRSDLAEEERIWVPQRWLSHEVDLGCSSSKSLRYEDTLSMAMAAPKLHNRWGKRWLLLQPGDFIHGWMENVTHTRGISHRTLSRLTIGMVSEAKCFTQEKQPCNSNNVESIAVCNREESTIQRLAFDFHFFIFIF